MSHESGHDPTERTSDEYENRLRILIINFLRESNIPFSVVDNFSFHEILYHLNPSVEPPTFTSILEMATVDHDKFKNYEQILKKDEIGKKQEIEAANGRMALIRNRVQDLRPSVLLNPTEFRYTGGSGRFPLNLKELPTPSDLDKIGTFDTDPQLSSWPCVVCLKRQKWSKVRTLTINEASIFLFVCVSQGVYSLEVAQKVYSFRMLKCCTDHFLAVYETTLCLLGISTPDQITKASDTLIAEARMVVRNIKDGRYGNIYSKPDRDRSSGPFRHSLKCFFKNYVPRSTVLAGFVDVRPYRAPKGRQKKQSPVESLTWQPVDHDVSQPSPPVFQQFGSLGEVIDFPDELLETENYAVPPTTNRFDSIENL